MKSRNIRQIIVLLVSLATVLCMGVVLSGCGCGDSGESTQADATSDTGTEANGELEELTLPLDEFDTESNVDKAKAEIAKLEEIQKDGVDDNEKEEYEKTAENIKKLIPKTAEVVDAGKDSGTIDTDALKEKVKEAEEESARQTDEDDTKNQGEGESESESESESQSQEADPTAPTLPYGGKPIELPTITFD